jgi:two-component system sensor histidine kinase DesK
MLATIAFGAVYMWLWLRARVDPRRLARSAPLSFAVPYLLGLTVLAGVMIVCLGEDGMAAVVYIAVAVVMTCPLRVALPTVLLMLVATLATSAIPGWGEQVGTAFGIAAASIAVFGMRTVMTRNTELFRAQEINSRLAVDNERNRFARDLHDILGHSLTVITVKAELAQRLIDVDPERARIELADLERLSRDALADVRRAVEGYRDLTLPGELARARAALTAAEITPHLPQSTEMVPSELRELFAWTVREGVTNVLRHSGAASCTIELGPDRVAVIDDGSGAASAVVGSGLLGLRERASAVGASVATPTMAQGFCLEVRRA